MQVHIHPSNPNVKEEHKRERLCGFCFPRWVLKVGVFKGFIARSVLIPGLGAIECRLVRKDKRCISELALVTMRSPPFCVFLGGFNTGAWANPQGDRKAFAYLDVAN